MERWTDRVAGWTDQMERWKKRMVSLRDRVDEWGEDEAMEGLGGDMKEEDGEMEGWRNRGMKGWDGRRGFRDGGWRNRGIK